jgi:hypothetical protein
LLHLLVLLSLLFGAVPWQAPRAVYAAPVTPTQSLHAQMQPAHQQPDGERASPTRSDSDTPFGPPVQSEAQLTRYEHPAVIAPIAISPAPEVGLNRPDDAPAESAVTTSSAVAAPDSTPTPQAITTPASVTRAEARTQTEQNPATQTRVYLPLIQSAGAGRTTEVKITSDGGQLRSPDGRVQLDVPAGAVDEDVWIMLIQDGTHPPIGALHSLGVFFELTARTDDGQPVTQFAQSLTLRVRYIPGAGMTDSTNGLFYYDEQQQRWQALETNDDAATGLLTATTDHFTLFGAFATRADESCTPAPGQDATDSGAVAAFKSIFDDQNLNLGCPTSEAYQWEGAWTQNFIGGAAIYNSTQRIAYALEGNYLQAYSSAGGPSGFLGLPIEQQDAAPDWYKDDNNDFRSGPIMYFDHGFIALDQTSGIVEAHRNFPEIKTVTWETRWEETGQTDEHDNPFYRFVVRGTVDDAIANPNGKASDTPALHAGYWVYAADGSFDGGHLALAVGQMGELTFPEVYTETQEYQFYFFVYRDAPDDLSGYAPCQHGFVDNPEDGRFNGVTATGTTTWNVNCEDGTGPGGGVTVDLPPQINIDRIWPDGHGNVAINAQATDDNGIASVTLASDMGTIADPAMSLLPAAGPDIYSGAIYDVPVNEKTLFTVTATDTSGQSVTVNQDTRVPVSASYGVNCPQTCYEFDFVHLLDK